MYNGVNDGLLYGSDAASGDSQLHPCVWHNDTRGRLSKYGRKNGTLKVFLLLMDGYSPLNNSLTP